MTVVGMKATEQSAAFVSVGTIQILQYTLLMIGAVGSVYTVHRIAKSHYSSTKIMRSAVPFTLLIVILTVANIYFFMLPMMHRM